MVIFISLIYSGFPFTVILFISLMPSVKLITFSLFPPAALTILRELNPLFLFFKWHWGSQFSASYLLNTSNGHNFCFWTLKLLGHFVLAARVSDEKNKLLYFPFHAFLLCCFLGCVGYGSYSPYLAVRGSLAREISFYYLFLSFSLFLSPWKSSIRY